MTNNPQKSATQERLCVLVLGMHRSGTSALTRMLNLLGCDLPKTLLKATDTNETGHWESVPLIALNDEILNSAGSTWYDWTTFNRDWLNSPKAADYKKAARKVIDEEFGSSSLLALKDPRICRLTPFWLDVLQEASIRPLVVVTLRNPLEVASSIEMRNKMDRGYGQLLWLRYMLDAEIASRGRQRYFSTYAGLLEDWSDIANGIAKTFDLTWPRMSAKGSDEIREFLSPELQHHIYSSNNLLNDPFVSSWIKDAFEIFSRWAASGESQADYAKLDQIRSELDQATPAFNRVLANAWAAAQRVKSLDSQLGKANSDLSVTQSELAAATQDKEQEAARTRRLASELEAMGLRLQAETSRADQFVEKAKLAEAHVQELSDQHAQSLALQLEQFEAKFASYEEKVEEAKETIKSLEGQLATASKELSSNRAEVERLTAQIEVRFEEITAISKLLKSKEAAAKSVAEQVKWLRRVAVALAVPAGTGLRGRLGSYMPASIRYAKQLESLKNQRIFDCEAYLSTNRDVAEAGLEPLFHFLNHGMDEARSLGFEPKKG